MSDNYILIISYNLILITMKSNIKILVLLLALIVFSVIFTKQASAQQNYVSFQVFYDQLSPYGQWVDYPNYGYVWIPDAESDFVPYSTRGHWILTDYGWTWASDYNWGWAPFHYGRWNYDNSYGWFWVPDNEWGPAWVTWRRANGYYGWAPMEPGVSLSISFGREYDRNNDHWIFVQDRYFDRSDVNRYYVNRTDHERIIGNSTVINNTYVDNGRHTTYVTGPGREDVQKVTGRRVSPVTIQENNKPGQALSNGQLRIYRPQVIKSNEKEQKPAPSRITNLKDLKQPSERNATNQQQNANPSQNNRRVEKPNTVNQRNNNNNAKSLQQQNANPSQNNRRVEKQNTVNQRNNNNNAKSLQQQNANPSGNNKKVQQPVNVKPTNKNKNEQPKKSKSEQENKKTD
jgi:hypothetical protein